MKFKLQQQFTKSNHTSRRTRATAAATVAGSLLLPLSSVFAQTPASAVAELTGCIDPNVVGIARLQEESSSEGVKVVKVSVQISGLEPSTKHAVHLHEAGQCVPCTAAAGHFDPGPDSNSSPDGNHPFHMGDLINLVVDENGLGVMQTVTNRVTLSPGPLSLFDEDGSAVIVHVDPDTYCLEGEAGGCAGGARAACGVIAAQ